MKRGRFMKGKVYEMQPASPISLHYAKTHSFLFQSL